MNIHKLGARKLSSLKPFSLQVDVLCGAGVLQMFLVVLLEGSSTDKTDMNNDQPVICENTASRSNESGSGFTKKKVVQTQNSY